jgi:hypothetical protein
MARWHEKLQDYNFKIIHVQGKNNTLADALSRPNDDKWQMEERQIALIPPKVFVNLANTDPTNLLEYQLGKWQQDHSKWIEDLKTEHWFWKRGSTWVDPRGRLVVPLDNLLKKQIMHTYHDRLSGHPGQDKTVRKILGQFYWPDA